MRVPRQGSNLLIGVANLENKDKQSKESGQNCFGDGFKCIKDVIAEKIMPIRHLGAYHLPNVKVAKLVGMNGTSNTLNFKASIAKIDKFKSFTYNKMPGVNENTGRLCLQTTDLNAGDDPSMWPDKDSNDEGFISCNDQLMNYDDEAYKLFTKLNLP